MKLPLSRPVLFLLAALLALTGCSRNRIRPDPSATMPMGPAGGDIGLNARPLDLNPDAPGLTQRGNGVIEDADTIRNLLEAVFFGFDSSSIDPAERSKIQAVKDYLDKNPQHRVRFEGYCDWRGTAEYNLALGDRRAAAVKNFLTTLGVAASRVEILSKGSLEAARNADDNTMKRDRRAEVVILKH